MFPRLNAALIVAACSPILSGQITLAQPAESREPPSVQTDSPPATTDTPSEESAGSAAPSEAAKAELSPQQTSRDPLPPTRVEEELAQIRPGLALKREFDRLAAEANIRLGIANTLLFQQATGGPGTRSAAGGDLDLLANWTAVGAGTKDTGILSFAAEYRYQIGSQAPSALVGEIGTLTPTTNGFGERPMVVKSVYWDQRLFEDTFRFAVGRIDPENLFGAHRLQSANTFFLNKVFSSNPAVSYPGPGMAAAAQFKPAEWFYLTTGLTDANGSATTSNFKGFFENHEYLTFGEAGFTPKIEGLGVGRYRVALWHLNAREKGDKPSDGGVTISCDQDIGEHWIVFLRYGHADGSATGISDSIQGGLGLKGTFGEENMLGLAAAWSRPTDDDKRDEKVVELFQRFQITETMQFTVGAEMIFDPSNAPDDDTLGVFSARLRLSF